MLIGRPNGGVLIIYPDTFGAKAKFISTTSKRLCALSLHMSNIILHLFCVYMPCDINNDSNIDGISLNSIGNFNLMYETKCRAYMYRQGI